MWKCDGCGNVNAEGSATCLRCGRVPQAAPTLLPLGEDGPAYPPVGYVDLTKPAVGSGYVPGMPPPSSAPSPASAGPRAPLPEGAVYRPPSAWFVWRMAMFRQPLVVAVMAVLLVLELIPDFRFGWSAFIPGMLSFILIGGVVVELWKRSYLRARGARVLGQVTHIRYASALKGYPTPHATVQYNAFGQELLIKDEYGGGYYNYVQVGDKVSVLYDPAFPNFAMLDMPESRPAAALIALGITGLFLYWVAGWIHLVTITWVPLNGADNS